VDRGGRPAAGRPAARPARLEEGRAILVTPVLKERLGVREGDLLALETRRGKRDYRVAGFFDSVMQNGSYALVSERNMRADFAQKHYGVLYVRAAGEAGQAAAEIERKLGRRRAWIRTIDQLSEENYRSNERIFRILQGFSVMILLIAVVGVFNNFVVSFLARRRSMAVLFSVGMSRRQGAGTLLIEAGSGGLIGGATGISAGFLLIRTVPAVLRAVNLSVTPVTPGRCS
jgi:putative ABC transport system permease protein